MTHLDVVKILLGRMAQGLYKITEAKVDGRHHMAMQVMTALQHICANRKALHLLIVILQTKNRKMQSKTYFKMFHYNADHYVRLNLKMQRYSAHKTLVSGN